MILLWQCSYCFFNKKSVVCFEMRAAQARGPPHTPPVPVRETRTQQLQAGARCRRRPASLGRSLFKSETKRRVLLLCLPSSHPSLPGRAVCASPFVLFFENKPDSDLVGVCLLCLAGPNRPTPCQQPSRLDRFAIAAVVRCWCMRPVRLRVTHAIIGKTHWALARHPYAAVVRGLMPCYAYLVLLLWW
jgi:hypothetical protein